MQTMLDLMTSVIVGGMLLLAVLTYNDDLMATNQRNLLYQLVQQNTWDLQLIMEEDLKLIGSGVADSTAVFTTADSHHVAFIADLGMDGSINTLRYYVGDESSAAGSENPNDRALFRQVDSESPWPIRLGLTALRFQYFDSNGLVTADLGSIRQVGWEYQVESFYAYNEAYPAAWQSGRVSPRNLN